jgi:hypothetical protein
MPHNFKIMPHKNRNMSHKFRIIPHKFRNILDKNRNITHKFRIMSHKNRNMWHVSVFIREVRLLFAFLQVSFSGIYELTEAFFVENSMFYQNEGLTILRGSGFIDNVISVKRLARRTERKARSEGGLVGGARTWSDGLTARLWERARQKEYHSLTIVAL